MIDAKRVFRKILRDWGHDILYQRRLSDDFVYSDTLERITTRSMVAKTSAMATRLEEQVEGYVVNSDLIYYFEDWVEPKSGDRIYEEGDGSLDDAIVYLIDSSYGVRGRHGKINYWIVGATKESPSS